MISIQRRLGFGLAAVLLVVGLALAQAGLWLFDQGLRRYLASGLQDEAESLPVAIIRGPAGCIFFRWSRWHYGGVEIIGKADNG